MNSKKPIIIASVVAVVIVLVLTILLIALSGKNDNSEGNLSVENKVSTEKDDDKNTSKDEEDEEEDDDDDNDENETNTNTSNRKKTRDEEEDELMKALEETERLTFNSKFIKYKGKQIGSNVSVLLSCLEANSETQGDNENHLPYIIYINSDGEYYEETTDVSIINEDIGEINKANTYYVEMAENEESGLIHGIVISYTINDDIKEAVEDLAKEIANK